MNWLGNPAFNIDGWVLRSPLDGGLFLFGENFAFISSYEVSEEDGRSRAKDLTEMKEDLVRAGIPETGIHTLPMQSMDLCPPWLMQELGIRKGILGKSDHVDWETVVQKDGRRIAFNEFYYRSNREALDRLAEALNVETLTLWPDVNSYLANPSDLPLGGFLFDRASDRMAAAFARDGWQVHVTEQRYGMMGARGGARCASTFLWVKE
jgi:hypothetical protein